MVDDVMSGMELPDTEQEEDMTVEIFKKVMTFCLVFGAAYWFGLFAKHWDLWLKCFFDFDKKIWKI